MDTIVIGIAGGSGSGKTTLADTLVSYFGENEVSILRHDNYYKRNDDLTYEERAKLNYDHPDAFDTDLLCEHIRQLKSGRPIDMPVYDYSVHNRSEKTIRIQPNPVIILEGILILAEPRLVELMDFKIFVDTDADERILRRIIRDVNDRGRSLDSVIRQYRETVKPMHDQFVEPSKRKANIIIPEGGRNEAAMQVIVELIRSRLR
jgi:uridine kinase